MYAAPQYPHLLLLLIVQLAHDTPVSLQMPDIFSSSQEFQTWFDSWSSAESVGQGGTDAARAAQREEQVRSAPSSPQMRVCELECRTSNKP